MKYWVLLLRMVGMLLLLFGVIGQGYLFVISPLRADTVVFGYITNILQTLAIALICFGSGSALVHIRKLELKNDQQRTALRYLLKERREPPPHIPLPPTQHAMMRPVYRRESIAPDAPSAYDPVAPYPYNDVQKKVISKKQQMMRDALKDPEVLRRIQPPSKRRQISER